MKLPRKQAQDFLEIYKNLLQFIFLKEFGEEIESINDYQEAREILFENISVVDEFISLGKQIRKYHIEILENIKKGIKDTFIYLKTLKKHSLLLSSSTNKIYCVLGITDSIEEIVPGKFAIIETVILNFGDQIICDGLISCCNVTIGPNMRKDINAQYKKAQENKELIQHITKVLS
ncbi:MAG: hypothetical protein HY739_05740 [Desulfobacterales bacterium]|nr:hypothetical protein [Desulfobacterales bacterium]